MHKRIPLIVLALAAAIALAVSVGPVEGLGAQQPPPKKGPPPDGKGKGPKGPKGPKGKGFDAQPVTGDDIVARLLAFDTDQTGVVTKEQLPERMQHLVDLGDTNKDGALDEDEIRALAAKLAREMPTAGQGKGPGGKGPDGKGPPGKGPGGKGFGFGKGGGG